MLCFDIETGALDEETLLEQFVPKTREEFVGAQRWKPETIDAKYSEYLVKAQSDFIQKAALDPTTGQVLAIGLKSDKGMSILDSVNEEKLLLDFWGKVRKWEAEGRSLVGHNCIGFDMPFLMRRSWILGIDFPVKLTIVKDTMKVWSCGAYNEWISLDRLGKALGLGGKMEGMDGGDFARLWNGTPEEHEQAKAYLIHDLDLTWKVANRLGVM
jgi:3'-5' exonuclease